MSDAKKYEWGYIARFTAPEKGEEVYEEDGGMSEADARNHVEAEQAHEDRAYAPYRPDARLHCKYTLRRREVMAWEEVE